MTITTEINGQPFEIELADGLNVEFSEGRIKVTKHSTLAQLRQKYTPLPLPALPPNPYPPQPNPYITWCAADTGPQ